MRYLVILAAYIMSAAVCISQHIIADVTPRSGGVDPRALSIAAWGDDTVMAMTTRGQVFHSVDAGVTWTMSTMPPIDTLVNESYASGFQAPDGTVFAITRMYGSRAMYGTDSAHCRIYRSVDKGLSWIKILDTTNVQIMDMAVGPTGELAIVGILYSGPPLNASTSIGMISSKRHSSWSSMSSKIWNREVEWAADGSIYALALNEISGGQRLDLLRSLDDGVTFDSIATKPSEAASFNFMRALDRGTVLIDLYGKILSVDPTTGTSDLVPVPFDTTNSLCLTGVPALSVDEIPTTTTLIHAGNACNDLAFSRDEGKSWTLETTTLLFDPCCAEGYGYVVVPTSTRAWMSSVYLDPATFVLHGLLRRVTLDLAPTSFVDQTIEKESPTLKLLWTSDVLGRQVHETFRGLVIRVFISPSGEITTLKEWQGGY